MRPTLTPRAAEAIELVASGSSYKQAAAEMGISVRMVKRYVYDVARTIPGNTAPLLKVVRWYWEHADPGATSRDIRADPARRAQTIYFVQAGDEGPVKIGTSKFVNERLATLQTHSPYPLRLIGTIEGDEAKIHARFSHLRLHGEWFRPGDDLLEFINDEVPSGTGGSPSDR